MNFFCTKEHYFNWTNKNKIDPNTIFRLDASEAILVAEMLFE